MAPVKKAGSNDPALNSGAIMHKNPIQGILQLILPTLILIRMAILAVMPHLSSPGERSFDSFPTVKHYLISILADFPLT